LLPRLVDIDDRYLRLLNESRTSASELYIAIQNFMEIAIPISQDTNNPLEERIAIIKDFADKIALSAKKDLQPYDTELEALKENLKGLLTDLSDIEATLKERSKLANDEQSVVTSKDMDNEHSKPHQFRYYWIFLVKLLEGVVGRVVPLSVRGKAPVTTASLKSTSSSATVADEVLRDISSLVGLFSGLVGKLGHFGVVWEKLVADSSELSAYLSHGGGDQDVIGNRLQAEVGVFEKIKQALDDYSLRTV